MLLYTDSLITIAIWLYWLVYIRYCGKDDILIGCVWEYWNENVMWRIMNDTAYVGLYKPLDVEWINMYYCIVYMYK